MTSSAKKQLSLLLIALVIVGGLIFFFLRAGQRATAAQHAVTALKSTPYFHVNTELVLHLPERLNNRQRPFTTLTARVEGDVARLATGTPELTGKLLLSTTGPGAELYANGDLQILDNAVAFRLANLSPLFNPSGSLVKKWTYVETPLLQTKNSAEIEAAVTQFLQTLHYQGKTTIADTSTWEFTGVPTPEQEEALTAVLQKTASGNQAFHIVARLLRATTVKTLVVYVEPRSQQLRRLSATFVQPLADGQEFHRATLTVDINPLETPVSIERPPQQLTVRPQVFGKLFGTGEITPQE